MGTELSFGPDGWQESEDRMYRGTSYVLTPVDPTPGAAKSDHGVAIMAVWDQVKMIKK